MAESFRSIMGNSSDDSILSIYNILSSDEFPTMNVENKVKKGKQTKKYRFS